MAKFAIIGCGGYIAPAHMEAIAKTGNELVAAADLNDSVGILDRYSPHCTFWKDTAQFYRHIEKRQDVDFVSICTPNYLHDAHTRLALRLGCNVICEKPLCLNPANLDELRRLEEATGRHVYALLQRRHHPAVARMQKKYQQAEKSFCKENHVNITMEYAAPRGPWYRQSWKGDIRLSGGLLVNIGVHLFDLLCWVFGSPTAIECTGGDNDDYYAGTITIGDRTTCTWSLSSRFQDSPKPVRVFKVNGEDFRLDDESALGEHLHVKAYRAILDGKGFGIEDAAMAIQLVERLRYAATGQREYK